ncbi:MAG: phytoene desaturase family protein [Pseudomonadota bacterium]|nr:phytoene desaturase family protein [Pseudomonadota bacterium]
MTTQKKLIVIGGGFGGIASALRARKLGYDVTIFDKASKLGGKAQVYTHGEFKHDAGPTVITAPFLIDELFELFNKKREDYIQFIRLTTWYQFRFSDNTLFNYGGSINDTLEEINKISPNDKKGYLSLLEASKKIYNIGFEKLATKPFHKISTLLKFTPSMIKLKSYQSVWSLVCSHLKSDKLRQAFSIQPLLVGGNPFDTTSIYNLIHFLERKDGIYFAKGGTGNLINALTKLMDEQQIKIKLKQNITAINLDRRSRRVMGVTTSDNEFHPCNYIISNTDPHYLYKHLLPKTAINLSAKIKNRFTKKSMGLFILFFGTKKQYPNIKHHTISLSPRYKTLLKDIFDHKIVPDDFSLYLHRPTATDDSFAPKGCDSFYALVPVANLQGGQNWDILGPQFQKRVLDNLEKTLLPDLNKHLDHVFYKSPKDFQHEHLNVDGEAFSIAPLFYQSAWFRYHNQAEGVKNLFLVGAGTHPGAGLPGVLSSAKVAIKLLSKAESQTRVTT